MKNVPLESRVAVIMNALGNPPDLQARYVHNGEICLLHLEGLVDIHLCQESVVKPLGNIPEDQLALPSIIESLTALRVTIRDDENEIPKHLLNGSIILLNMKANQFLAINLGKYEKRDVNTQEMESTIRGPQDGFVEDLNTNRTLIRRRLKTEELRIVSVHVGTYSNISAEIYYMEGIADPHLVSQIIQKITNLQTKFVPDSSHIEKYLDRRKVKIMPIIQNTQRPDTVVSNLMEGRIAILVDGSPDVLLLPAVFWHFLETPEDYYDLSSFAFFVKTLRLLAFFFSLTLPGIYVAVTTFHWGLIPTDLLITFASSRSGVPYPIILEVLLLELVFEVLREAGMRFPKNMGQVVSIVGGLVIGDAAVQAGLVSAPTVIIVAFTGIASFIVPKHSFGQSARLLRFPLLATSTIAGLLGLFLSFSVILTHFIYVKSFGISYMSPFSKAHGMSIKRWWLSTSQVKED